jgi:hypothetical protein
MSRNSLSVHGIIIALQNADHERTSVLDAIDATKCYLHNEGAKRNLCKPYCQPSGQPRVPEPTRGELLALMDELCGWVIRNLHAHGIVCDISPLHEFRSVESQSYEFGKGTIPSSGISLVREPTRKLTDQQWNVYAGRADVALSTLRELLQSAASAIEVFVLIPADITILTVLARAGRTLHYADIQTMAHKLCSESNKTEGKGSWESGQFVNVSDTVLRERVPLLLKHGLVARPVRTDGQPSQRMGIGITPDGMNRIGLRSKSEFTS